MKDHPRYRQKSVFMKLDRNLVVSAVGAAALLATFAAWSQPKAVLTENVDELTATVTAIEEDTRLVSLEADDGRELTVEAGDQVQNFDQIDVGDTVEVMFYEALAAEVSEAPEASEAPQNADGPSAAVIATRAAPGEKPAGAAGIVYTAIVTIDSVDVDNDTVNFTGPEGQPREVTVERPEMQEFIAGLQPGDRVQVTYSEAVAVALTPTPSQ